MLLWLVNLDLAASPSAAVASVAAPNYRPKFKQAQNPLIQDEFEQAIEADKPRKIRK